MKMLEDHGTEDNYVRGNHNSLINKILLLSFFLFLFENKVSEKIA